MNNFNSLGNPILFVVHYYFKFVIAIAFPLYVSKKSIQVKIEVHLY
jgi:hypothetical protein